MNRKMMFGSVSIFDLISQVDLSLFKGLLDPLITSFSMSMATGLLLKQEVNFFKRLLASMLLSACVVFVCRELGISLGMITLFVCLVSGFPTEILTILDSVIKSIAEPVKKAIPGLVEYFVNKLKK
jgi:hypothetical protein